MSSESKGTKSKHDNLLSTRIAKQAIDQYANANGKAASLRKIAAAIDIPTDRIYAYQFGRRKWQIDAWLKTLAAMGALKIKDGNILITTKVDDETLESFAKLQVQDYTKR